MVDYFIGTSSFESSSEYWHWLNKKNIEQLAESGYGNFKQTVARNYFTWFGGLDTGYVRKLLKDRSEADLALPLKEILRKQMDLSIDESVLYNIATVILLDFVLRKKVGSYIQMLEEPLEGNPPFINYQNRRITQDILNGLLEYMSITDGCDTTKISSILEVGAGSGRTAFCLLKLLPGVKYVVVDIPPALFVSQSYLLSVFAGKKVFKFKPFKSFAEIEQRYEASDLIFLMPDQLDLLPPRSIDLFLAIDCLHEMKKMQVNLYFDAVQKLAKNFYFKCWQETTVPFDDITYTIEDYPLKSNWIEIYKRNCEVPSTYFEAFYRIDRT